MSDETPYLARVAAQRAKDDLKAGEAPLRKATAVWDVPSTGEPAAAETSRTVPEPVCSCPPVSVLDADPTPAALGGRSPVRMTNPLCPVHGSAQRPIPGSMPVGSCIHCDRLDLPCDGSCRRTVGELVVSRADPSVAATWNVGPGLPSGKLMLKVPASMEDWARFAKWGERMRQPDIASAFRKLLDEAGA